MLECSTLKITGRQRTEAIERQQVRRRAQLAVLRRRGTKRARGQIAAQLGQLARMRPLALVRAANRNRFDVLAAKHRAAAASSGVPSVMRDRRVTDSALTRRSD